MSVFRIHTSPHTDAQALLDLAADWRQAEHEMRRDHGSIVDAPMRGHYPGPRITAIQLEWAAREIERLRGHKAEQQQPAGLPESDQGGAQ